MNCKLKFQKKVIDKTREMYYYIQVPYFISVLDYKLQAHVL
jgi:hypothetical protein